MRKNNKGMLGNRVIIWMLFGVMFGMVLGAPLGSGSNYVVGMNYWTRETGDGFLYPTNSSDDVSLNNNSLLWADLSSFAGDNVTWDAVDMEFDVSADGTSKWNDDDTALFPKTNGRDVQVNGSIDSDNFTIANGAFALFRHPDTNNFAFTTILDSLEFRGHSSTETRFFNNLQMRDGKSFGALDPNNVDAVQLWHDGDNGILRVILTDLKLYSGTNLDVNNNYIYNVANLTVGDIDVSGNINANNSDVYASAFFGDGGNLNNMTEDGDPFFNASDAHDITWEMADDWNVSFWNRSGTTMFPFFNDDDIQVNGTVNGSNVECSYLDVGNDANITGTLSADNLSVDTIYKSSGTNITFWDDVVVGEEDTGRDVTFWSGYPSKYFLWDKSKAGIRLEGSMSYLTDPNSNYWLYVKGATNDKVSMFNVDWTNTKIEGMAMVVGGPLNFIYHEQRSGLAFSLGAYGVNIVADFDSTINGCTLNGFQSNVGLKSTRAKAVGNYNFAGLRVDWKDAGIGQITGGTYNFDGLLIKGKPDNYDTTGGTLNYNAIKTQHGNVIFNDLSGDWDFRVESNNSIDMLFVDGGNDNVGINTSTPNCELQVIGDVNATGGFATDTGVGWSGTYTATEGVVTVRNGIIIDVDWD